MKLSGIEAFSLNLQLVGTGVIFVIQKISPEPKTH